jgi:uncharacterized membrane protein (UPF0127 family)
MSALLQITEASSGKSVAMKCVHARNPWTRLVGLLNRSQLDAGEGLLIEPCKQVHTFFMRFPIDVVFLDSKNQVLAKQSLKPWRLSPLIFKAAKVLEVPAGSTSDLRPGMQLEVRDA